MVGNLHLRDPTNLKSYHLSKLAKQARKSAPLILSQDGKNLRLTTESNRSMLLILRIYEIVAQWFASKIGFQLSPLFLLTSYPFEPISLPQSCCSIYIESNVGYTM